MPALDKIVENLQSGDTHKDFRLVEPREIKPLVLLTVDPTRIILNITILKGQRKVFITSEYS